MDTARESGGARQRRDDLWALLLVGALVGDAAWLGWNARTTAHEVVAPNETRRLPRMQSDHAAETPTSSASTGTEPASSSITAVDPATASPRELRTLPGIGEARAIAIADARWRLPPGASLSLGDISGIGPVTEARVRALLDQARPRAAASAGARLAAPANPQTDTGDPGDAGSSWAPSGSAPPAADADSRSTGAAPMRTGVLAPATPVRTAPAPFVPPEKAEFDPAESRGAPVRPTGPTLPDNRAPPPAAPGAAGSGGRVGAVHSSDLSPPTSLGHLSIPPARRAPRADAAPRPP